MSGYGMFDAPPAEGLPKKPTRQAPGRGVLDGIKKDIQAAKEGDAEYDPRGVGAGWNHSFLLKKPWHPSNFRNMARVWEKEHDHYEAEKKKAEGKAEFEAEQAYLKTLSMLSPEEQEKYRQRQSVSFLYMKPPGYDAALERAEQAKQAGQAVGPGGAPLPAGQASAAAGGQQQPGPGGAPPGGAQGQGGHRGRPQVGAGGHLQNVIGGIKAVQQQQGQRYELKHLPNGGRSPPRGGGPLDAENQTFVVADMDSEEEVAAIRLAVMPPEERRRREREAAAAARQQQRERERAARQRRKAAATAQLEQAKAFLRAAGLALPSDEEAGGSDSGSGSSGVDGGGGSGRHKRRRQGGKAGGGEGKGKGRGRAEKKSKKKRRHKEG